MFTQLAVISVILSLTLAATVAPVTDTLTVEELEEGVTETREEMENLKEQLDGLIGKAIMGGKTEQDWADLMTDMAEHMKDSHEMFFHAISKVFDLGLKMFSTDHEFQRVTRCKNLARTTQDAGLCQPEPTCSWQEHPNWKFRRVVNKLGHSINRFTSAFVLILLILLPFGLSALFWMIFIHVLHFGKEEFLPMVELALAKDLMCFSNLLDETAAMKVSKPGNTPSENQVVKFMADSILDLFMLKNDGERFLWAVHHVTAAYTSLAPNLHQLFTDKLSERQEVVRQLIRALNLKH